MPIDAPFISRTLTFSKVEQSDSPRDVSILKLTQTREDLTGNGDSTCVKFGHKLSSVSVYSIWKHNMVGHKIGPFCQGEKNVVRPSGFFAL